MVGSSYSVNFMHSLTVQHLIIVINFTNENQIKLKKVISILNIIIEAVGTSPLISFSFITSSETPQNHFFKNLICGDKDGLRKLL